MTKKQILIVDDDWDILFLLTHSVKRLSTDYEVTTAMDGPDALKQISSHSFNLVITDHMMPQMTGLQLTQSIRKTSPDTKVILMTAYNPDRIPASLEKEGLDAFIGKPFKIPEVLSIVQEMLNAPSQKVEDESLPEYAISARILQILEDLWYKTNLDLILLSNTNGIPLHVMGDADKQYVARLATFVSDNFLAVSELASLLGDNESSFKSSYHEGDRYNIYSYNIDGERLLTVMFDSERKPGPIWIYTKQTANELVDRF